MTQRLTDPTSVEPCGPQRDGSLRPSGCRVLHSSSITSCTMVEAPGERSVSFPPNSRYLSSNRVRLCFSLSRQRWRQQVKTTALTQRASSRLTHRLPFPHLPGGTFPSMVGWSLYTTNDVCPLVLFKETHSFTELRHSQCVVKSISGLVFIKKKKKKQPPGNGRFFFFFFQCCLLGDSTQR